MLSLKAALPLTAVLALTSSGTVFADQQEGAPPKEPAVAAEEAEQAQATGTITGVIALPDQTPDWYRGGELAFADAVARIESVPQPTPMKRPDNYREMTREERKAWFDAYKLTQEYKDYRAAAMEAYKNRQIFEFPVNADGSFEATGLEPGRYNVITLFPHTDATEEHKVRQSWATGTKQVVIKEAGQAINTGPLKMRLSNVLMPGEEAPAWTATDLEGNEVSLADFQGKYVLLDFWATWCGPCIAEMPNLKQTYETYGGEQFEVVALSLDKTIDLPIKFLEKKPAPYTQLYLGQWNVDETTARAYGVNGIPSIWLIGPDGKVVARDLRGEDLRNAVKEAVGTAPATN